MHADCIPHAPELPMTLIVGEITGAVPGGRAESGEGSKEKVRRKDAVALVYSVPYPGQL